MPVTLARGPLTHLVGLPEPDVKGGLPERFDGLWREQVLGSTGDRQPLGRDKGHRPHAGWGMFPPLPPVPFQGHLCTGSRATFYQNSGECQPPGAETPSVAAGGRGEGTGKVVGRQRCAAPWYCWRSPEVFQTRSTLHPQEGNFATCQLPLNTPDSKKIH